MRRKFLHSLVGMSLVAALVTAPQTSAGAQAWLGFTATAIDTNIVLNPQVEPPGWGAAITEDLGGAGTDVWTGNHANRGEAHLDFGTSDFTGQYLGPTGIDAHGMVFSDLDADGDDDAIELGGVNSENRVYRNDNGTLAVVQTTTGLEDMTGRGRQPLLLDFDNDGDMDVLVANLLNGGTPSPSELYLNTGSFTWSKVNDAAGALTDNDIILAHQTGTGPGSDNVVISSSNFSIAMDTIATGATTMAENARLVKPLTGPTKNATHIRDIALGDLDGDLDADFVVARQDNNLETDDLPPEDPGPPVVPAGDGIPDLEGMLPIGTGAIELAQVDQFDLFTASPIAPVSNDALADNCRAVALADFDNDADLDIFGGCTFDDVNSGAGQNRNIVLLNDGNGNFTLGSAALLPATVTDTAVAVVAGDLNGDGWVDTYVAGGYDSENGDDYVFMNQGGNGNHYLQIELDGANPDAAGARVYVGTNKWQVREMSHAQHQGQDSRVMHFGLADQTAIAQVQVHWGDGSVEACWVDGGVDQRVMITKGSVDCETSSVGELITTLGATPDTSPRPPSGPLCGDLQVTVDLSMGQTPTSGNDVILGTAGPDVINSLGGRDIICGLGGNDTIDAGDGDDKVFGGDGDDTLIGGAGNDRLFGEDGNDNIDGQDGRDVLRGGAGNDIMNGGKNNDRMSGNGGKDTMTAGNGRDRIDGNAGADNLDGGGGNDRMLGGGGNDIVDGRIGTDFCIEGETTLRCEFDFIP
ncbi:MAG: CRTAC homolog protein [Acidimicrobiales bacterium]